MANIWQKEIDDLSELIDMTNKAIESYPKDDTIAEYIKASIETFEYAKTFLAINYRQSIYHLRSFCIKNAKADGDGKYEAYRFPNIHNLVYIPKITKDLRNAPTRHILNLLDIEKTLQNSGYDFKLIRY